MIDSTVDQFENYDLVKDFDSFLSSLFSCRSGSIPLPLPQQSQALQLKARILPKIFATPKKTSTLLPKATTSTPEAIVRSHTGTKRTQLRNRQRRQFFKQLRQENRTLRHSNRTLELLPSHMRNPASIKQVLLPLLETQLVPSKVQRRPPPTDLLLDQQMDSRTLDTFLTESSSSSGAPPPPSYTVVELSLFSHQFNSALLESIRRLGISSPLFLTLPFLEYEKLKSFNSFVSTIIKKEIDLTHPLTVIHSPSPVNTIRALRATTLAELKQRLVSQTPPIVQPGHPGQASRTTSELVLNAHVSTDYPLPAHSLPTRLSGCQPTQSSPRKGKALSLRARFDKVVSDSSLQATYFPNGYINRWLRSKPRIILEQLFESSHVVEFLSKLFSQWSYGSFFLHPSIVNREFFEHPHLSTFVPCVPMS
jgi:hypothetical protein